MDFKPTTPGLEVKYAVEEAEKAGAKVTFAGKEFDIETIDGLRNSSHLFFFMLPLRAKPMVIESSLKHEYDDFKRVMLVRGGEAFSESFDKYRANFLIHLLNRIAPEQKKIIIDQKDESLFHKIYEASGDKIVAVVNQWHVTGIEERWRRATNTVNTEPAESPVVDMDIDQLQETKLINEFLRERNSKIGRTEPATGHDYITQYTKENLEYERTRHTHHRSAADIPEPGEEHKHDSHGKHH